MDVTIGVAILVSGFVSISLTPMLCSRFLKPPHASVTATCTTRSSGCSTTWLNVYDRTLTVALNFRFVTMAVSIALLVGTVYLFMIVPKGFLPSEDQGRFNVSTEAAQGIAFDDMVRHQSEVAAIIAQDPNVVGLHQQHRARSGRQRRRDQHGTHGRGPQAAIGPRDVGRSGDRVAPSEAGAGDRACACSW